MAAAAERSVCNEEEARNRKLFREKILPLDFFQDIIDDTKLDKPKNKSKDVDTAEDTNGKGDDSFSEIPLRFENEQQYIDLFFPLFMEEVKMQIQRCKFTEMSDKSEEASLHTFTKDGNLLKLDLRRLSAVSVTEVRYSHGDLLVFSQNSNLKEETPLHMLGLVDESVSERLKIFVMPGDLKGGDKTSRAFQISQTISERKTWHLAKICAMSTVVREFEALLALPRVPLRSLILNAQDRAPTKVNAEMQAAPPVAGINEDGGAGVDHDSSASAPVAVKEDAKPLAIPEKVEKFFESKYNESQRQAINESRKVAGITLVQGPPGTGKTTTILGILSMLLNARASISKSVSYTRTGKKRSRAGLDAQLDSETEDEVEAEESIQERKRQRVELMRQRAPWFRAGYVPWADMLEQQLPGRDLGAVSVSYPKISCSSIVPMSEIREEQRPQKVLVCAPSNAAIDEVLRRAVKEGIVNADGVSQRPAIVRVGPNLHPSLNEYSLEMQARSKVSTMVEQKNVNVYEEEKARIMKFSQIVCTTLSISGSRDLTGFPEEFDTVVIDEASQGVEVSTLVPLKLGCRRLILVGDPQQLPATCFSARARRHNYERSLFQRLEASDHKVTMLVEQFRMHPAISAFPSQNFYDGRLINVRNKEVFEKDFPAPWAKINCFGPVVFFHMKGSQTRSGIGSLINEEEAEFVVQLYSTLTELFPPEKSWRSRFAAISPYAEQTHLIRAKFRQFLGMSSKTTCPIDVNTVDGFQGREKDIVVVSAVRANEEENTIGFVRDKRRMNVAFTRARLNLWVVGHADVLRRNADWKAFIKLQQEECRFLRVAAPYPSFLVTYLKGWYERHPEEEMPKAKMFEADIGGIEEKSDKKVDEGFDGDISDVEVAAVDEQQQKDFETVSDAGLGDSSDAEDATSAHGDNLVQEPLGAVQAPDVEDGEAGGE